MATLAELKARRDAQMINRVRAALAEERRRGERAAKARRRAVARNCAHWLERDRKRKLGHIIIAAPDLDIEVISQRVAAEEIGEEIDQLTVYMSSSDAAIGLSTWMFRSKKRIGRLQSLDEMPAVQRQRAEMTKGRGTLLQSCVSMANRRGGTSIADSFHDWCGTGG